MANNTPAVGDLVSCKRELKHPVRTSPVLKPGCCGVVTAVINHGEHVAVDFALPVEVVVTPDELINHGQADDLFGWDAIALYARKAASA